MSLFSDFIAGPTVQVALAGAAGGLVRWITLRSPWQDGGLMIIVGGLSAIYLGPLAEPAITALIGSFVIDEISRKTFSGFAIGLGGIGVAGIVIDFWKTKRSGSGGNRDG